MNPSNQVSVHSQIMILSPDQTLSKNSYSYVCLLLSRIDLLFPELFSY